MKFVKLHDFTFTRSSKGWTVKGADLGGFGFGLPEGVDEKDLQDFREENGVLIFKVNKRKVTYELRTPKDNVIYDSTN